MHDQIDFFDSIDWDRMLSFHRLIVRDLGKCLTTEILLKFSNIFIILVTTSSDFLPKARGVNAPNLYVPLLLVTSIPF